MYFALICWGLETDGSSVCIHRRNDGIRTHALGVFRPTAGCCFVFFAAAFTFLLASGFDLVIVMGVACGLVFFSLFFFCFACVEMPIDETVSFFCPRATSFIYMLREVGDFRVGGGKSGWVRVCVYNESDDILRAARVPHDQ